MPDLISLYSDVDYRVNPQVILRVFWVFVVLEELSFFQRTIIFRLVKIFRWIQELKLRFFGIWVLWLLVSLPDEYETHEADHKILISQGGQISKSLEKVETRLLLGELIELKDKIILLIEGYTVEYFCKFLKQFFDIWFDFGVGWFSWFKIRH